MFRLLEVRKDRKARSEICPECEIQQERAGRGETVVRSTRTTVSLPARVV